MFRTAAKGGVMLLNTVFFVLFASSVVADRNGQPDRIHFELPKNNEKRRELQRIWPIEQRQTTITFIDESRKNDSNNWSSRPNQNSNWSELSNIRGNSTFNQNSGNGQFTGSGNNNNGWQSGWQSGWRPFSTMNENKKMNEKNKENFVWSGGSPDRENASTWVDIDRNKNKNSSKRNLLPEDTCGIDIPRRILGGSTADIDEYPWLALLQYRDRNGKISHDCGGVLISSRYVITAAHCTIGLGVTTRKLKLEKVRLGEWDLKSDKDCQFKICSEPVQDIGIEEIITHSNYKPRQSSQTHDIALIRLRRKAQMNQFVQPICLPMDDMADMNFERQMLAVAGWGKTTNAKNSESSVKMKVDIPVVSWDSCRNFYESFYSNVKIVKSQMCAGGEEGRDSCQGDSGGPLMSNNQVRNEFRWFVIGIVSSGPAACGVEGRPSLYTKVSDYNNWILDNLRD